MESKILKPGEFHQFKLGFAIELPKYHFARIEGRSGNAIMSGIDTIGNIIDENYRGEISAILVNNSEYDFVVLKGDRIAQMVIQKYTPAKFIVKEELSETVR